MSTFAPFELREIPLSLPLARRRRDSLLEAAGLGTVEADYCVGYFDSDDRIMATASLHGDVIKGVAVHPDARDNALLPGMLTTLLDHAVRQGIDNPKVFTKPEYAPMFRAMSFTEVGRSGTAAVMLEHSPTKLAEYRDYLSSLPLKGRVGCIVMHANPLTLGHMHLIEYSRGKCDTLVIIPVAESGVSEFTYAERRHMLLEATSGMPDVIVAEGSHYAVSRSSFPSYFIKEVSARTDAHIGLDLDIFVRHIAPALGANKRFVGTEPSDPLTARYNELMHSILPSHGVDVEEIPRLETDRCPVSASRVRSLLARRCAGEALPMVAGAAVPFILAHAAAAALRDELDTTPKPGLVDRDNSGAHTDMDHALMVASIEALTPVFARLAEQSGDDIDAIRSIGIEGERLMLEATGGINTHRGALFSLGLTVVAASGIWRENRQIDRSELQRRIMELAARFPRPTDTHGAAVGIRYGVPTALDAAISGYPEAFAENPSRHGCHLTLLRLMSRVTDSNIYHRCGPEVAEEVRRTAATLLNDYSHEAMRHLDASFSARRISPGGSADMLALALLLDSIAPDHTPHD